MGFPHWEGHGRSAGQVSRGFGPCSYQFLPGEVFLGLRDQLVCARLFKQNWRLWVMNCGKLKHLHFIAKEDLGSALPGEVSWWPAWTLGRSGGSWV